MKVCPVPWWSGFSSWNNWNSWAANCDVHILTLNTYNLCAACSPSTLLQESSRMFEKQWTSAQFLSTWWCYVLSYPSGLCMRTLFRSLKRDTMDAYWITLDPIWGSRELRASCILCFCETIEVDHWLCGTCRRIKLRQYSYDRSYCTCNYLQLLLSLARLSDVAGGHWQNQSKSLSPVLSCLRPLCHAECCFGQYAGREWWWEGIVWQKIYVYIYIVV